eukprot:CAMPEP_0114234490 /NCGR_PEP_ID=MMETSP0058-20121206/5737_1 /TAXON_ID=36894 /ORGANISM="Pyramimonas parkeae, CCMP726" /LENGTH=1041 /DNA_ID=CAMNT_0001346173 /DNA_START=77 /DNA_END=3202 /DNA_ORIENTATION=+
MSTQVLMEELFQKEIVNQQGEAASVDSSPSERVWNDASRARPSIPLQKSDRLNQNRTALVPRANRLGAARRSSTLGQSQRVTNGRDRLTLLPSYEWGRIISGKHDIKINGTCKADLISLCAAEVEAVRNAANSGLGHGRETEEQVKNSPGNITTRRHLTEEEAPSFSGLQPVLSQNFERSNATKQMGAPSSGKFGQFLESMARRRTNPNRRLGASTFPRRSAQGLSKLGFLGDRDIRLNGGGAPFTAPLARCIRRHVRMERFSISPDRAQVSVECKHTTRQFWEDRASDVRRDMPLIVACLPDIQKHCNETDVGVGRVLRCLKSNKSELQSSCTAVVTQRQVDSAEDVGLDTPLKVSCKQEVESLCPDVGYGGGAKFACLQSKRNQLGHMCQTELFRREVENAEDMRFNYRLASACAAEKQRFCENVHVGRGHAFGCLQRRMSEAEFSEECKIEMEQTIRNQGSDWRLDWRLRTFCYKDAVALCYPQVQLSLNSTMSEQSNASGVLGCLQFKYSEVASGSCRRELSRRISQSLQDIRNDYPASKQCGQEMKELCKHVKPGNGRIQACLEANKGSLRPQCQQILLTRNVLATHNWRFKFAIFSSCKKERQLFCKDVPEGENRVVRCLQDHTQDVEMSARCKKAVEIDEIKASGDSRLLPEVVDGCKEDMQALCPDARPDNGRMLYCLKQKRGHISAPTCRNAILRQFMRASENWKLDRPLAEACMDDVINFCKGKSSAAVHECLRSQEHNVTEACRTAEARMEMAEMEDIRLKPMVRNVCSDAIGTFCKDVVPGSARVITCLQEKIAEPLFPSACARRMKLVAQRSNERLAYNPRVLNGCQDEITKQCPGMNASNVAGGLGCLVEGYDSATHMCQTEVARSVKLALSIYVPESSVTRDCDNDAQQYCGLTTESSHFLRSGSISDCLMRRSGNLSASCWKLVSMGVSQASSGPGAETLFHGSNKMHNAIKKIAETANRQAANEAMKEFATHFIKTGRSSFVVLEGWPAIVVMACVCLLGGTVGYLGFRQLRNPNKGYIVYDKS